jgi:hypothetical protein
MLHLNRISFFYTWIAAILLSSGCSSHSRFEEPLDPRTISAKSGLTGSFNPATSTFKVTLQRPGLTTSVNGVPITPAMGLIAWATISGNKENAVMLGDIPLRESEINEAIRSALSAGVSPTALHNTFLMDTSRIMSLHIEKLGSEPVLSQSLGRLFKDLSEKRNSLDFQQKTLPKQIHSTLNAQAMESLLWKGEMVDGVYRLSLGRSAELAGHDLGDSAGVKTWAAFSGTNESAVVNGDIAAIEYELPSILKILIDSKIRIVSIHSHMAEEKPRLIFVHFWGEGNLTELARGVKKAFWLKEEFQSQ